MPRVVSLEELKRLVGHEIGVTDYMEITQGRIGAFSETTGDDYWIHVDPERAKTESPCGTTIAHGFLTLSLITLLTRQVFEISDAGMQINYGLNRVRFPSPVRSGSRVRAHVTVESAEDIPGGVQLELGVTVECEGSTKPACVAEWLLRYYS